MTCHTCKEAPAFEGCDDCVECVARYLREEDPDQLQSVRRIFAGTKWVETLDAEVARQTVVMESPVPNLRVLQAS